MKTTTIEFNLSERSISKAIRQLEQYKKRIILKMQQLIEVMCKDGETYACQYLTHIDTGETLGSIMGYREGNRGIITAGGAAVWIEFGTGTLANGGKSGGDPFHPDRNQLGISDWGTYGKGYGNGDNYPNGWFFYNEKTGRAGWTEGIAEEPFMANAAERLRDEFRKTAEKVFK